MRYIALICLLISLSSCWIARAYRIRRLELTDHHKLPSVDIKASAHPMLFTEVKDKSAYNLIEKLADSTISGTETAALLIIRNDSLVYEKYFLGFNQYSILPSNSIAKSFTGTLAGIAMQEGLLDAGAPITRYLPELGERDSRFHAITIRHLLDMRSGLLFNEGSYNLRDDAIRLSLRRNIRKHILRVKIDSLPGKFNYQSINTQLLGLAVQRATQTPLQDYLQQKLWQPMGTEHPATWNIDSRRHSQVLMSAGLNATARDFAKLGRLYLNRGMVAQTRILSPGWINAIASIDSMEKYDGYKNQFWNNRIRELYGDEAEANYRKRRKKYPVIQPVEAGYELSYREPAFSARGFMNQILYIDPYRKVIIVRIGRGWKKESRFIQSIYHLGMQL